MINEMRYYWQYYLISLSRLNNNELMKLDKTEQQRNNEIR